MYSLAAKLVSLLYSLFSLFPMQKKITFFSRQGRAMSLDFRMLSDGVRRLCPEARVEVCTIEPESKGRVSFALSTPKTLFHVATSRVCVLDGYIPAVSIPRIDSRTCVVQLWHAMGAIKKFGYQSLGTKAGRSEELARSLSMHKNYDWIVSAGKGAIPAYAEAFGYDRSRILPLGMPRMDYLLDRSEGSPRLRNVRLIADEKPWLENDGLLKILYAPTLRKGESYSGWMTKEVKKLSDAFGVYDCELIVAGHPLNDACSEVDLGTCSNIRFVEGVQTIDLLEFADCVLTDYSAVAFEAGLLEKPVWFYVPDIEEYRRSPGLNVDPLIEFPNVSFFDPDCLVQAMALSGLLPRGSAGLGECRDGGDSVGYDDFAIFMNRYFGAVHEGYTDKLSVFIRECYLGALKDRLG